MLVAMGTGLFLLFAMCGYTEQRLVSLAHITAAVASIVLTAYKIAFPEGGRSKRKRY